MFEIKGKYNSAVVMLPSIDLLDTSTKEQIQSFLDCFVFENLKIVIQPDCHAGAGSCIGFTCTTNDYVIPNIIGVDIGCGVLALHIGKKNIDVKIIDKYITKCIPSGFDVNDEIFTASDLKELDFAPPLAEVYEEIQEISKVVNSNPKRNCLALGSLGGGNHFVEIGEDENKEKWLVIHSGSRKFGLDIATYYQRKAIEKCEENKTDVPKSLSYLHSSDPLAKAYMESMWFAVFFARLNRKIIAMRICRALNVKIKDCELFESVHNYIGKDNIIRKGAIGAYKGDKVVIPFNMEDGMIIGVGKGNADWNYSAPHGAGRVMSRSQAKKELDLGEAKKSMREKGIFTTSLNDSTLDECKKAYKDKDLIMSAISDVVDVTHFVKPIYNFKSAE